MLDYQMTHSSAYLGSQCSVWESNFAPVPSLIPLPRIVTSGDLFVFTKFPPALFFVPTLLFLDENIVIISLDLLIAPSYLASLSHEWHLINIFLGFYQSSCPGLKKFSCHRK